MPINRDTELAGIYEVAEAFGVPKSTASMWYTRRAVNGFPEPVTVLQMGAVFDLAAIRRWAAGRVAPRHTKESA